MYDRRLDNILKVFINYYFLCKESKENAFFLFDKRDLGTIIDFRQS